MSTEEVHLTPETSPELTKRSWFGSLMGSERDEAYTILVRGKPLATVKADLIHAFLSVAELSHSVASPMSFKVEYKRGSSGPAMFQRQVRFQVDISPVPKPPSHPGPPHHHEKEFLYAITFILLSGNIRRFRRICEHVQSQVCSRRPPPPSPRATRKFGNSEQLSESSSCGSDSSDRLSPFSNSTNRQTESDRESDLRELKTQHRHQSKDIRCSASENSSGTLLLSEMNDPATPVHSTPKGHQQNNSAHHSHQHGHKGHSPTPHHHRGSSIGGQSPNNIKQSNGSTTSTNPFALLSSPLGSNKVSAHNNVALQGSTLNSNGMGGILKPVSNGTSSSTLSTLSSNSSPPPISIKKEQIV